MKDAFIHWFLTTPESLYESIMRSLYKQVKPSNWDRFRMWFVRKFL